VDAPKEEKKAKAHKTLATKCPGLPTGEESIEFRSNSHFHDQPSNLSILHLKPLNE
jgi:hypothetical protein